jgi:hypothetical protein
MIGDSPLATKSDSEPPMSFDSSSRRERSDQFVEDLRRLTADENPAALNYLVTLYQEHYTDRARRWMVYVLPAGCLALMGGCAAWALAWDRFWVYVLLFPPTLCLGIAAYYWSACESLALRAVRREMFPATVGSRSGLAES